MSSILLIARRDLRAYFSSPIAYIVLAIYLLVVGWMFVNIFSFFIQNAGGFNPFGGGKQTLAEGVLRPLFGNVNVMLLMMAPLITMRLMAEERRDHTIELLMTSPVSATSIVIGKFLAGTGMLLVMVACTLVYPLILQAVAHPDWGVIFASYLGIVFLSATYAAVGLFWSTLTENQIVAAILTWGSMLFFWLISWASHRAGPIWADVLNHLSLIGHYTNFSLGVVESSDIVYYLCFTGFALLLTHISVEAG